ncbi:hypothetical protein ACRB68_47170 [Actinomadura sp. RB68]|uniref:Cupin type-2 domain-containing protein n=1 Tax=Actinomadura macrotermitis TaxID=2585200 RepID=A0A7K0C0M3_9ACTN|nr:hypothetical protein [Actinomadura macrotermitis]
MLAGEMRFYLGGTRATVGEGGLVVVPPGLPHAFGAAAGTPADVLAVLTPGVERFECFRRLGRIGAGAEAFADLLPDQERFDGHFLDVPDWRAG